MFSVGIQSCFFPLVVEEKGVSKWRYKRAIIGPQAKHQIAFPWPGVYGPTLNASLVVFQGIRASIAKIPYIHSAAISEFQKWQALFHLQKVKYIIVTMQNGWNNRISDGCVYAQIRRGLGMHLVTYSNHDTVLFLLIVPIKGRFVWDGIHCVYIYQRLHDFLTLLEYLGNLVRFSIYKGWNFPFLLGDILNIPLKGSI